MSEGELKELLTSWGFEHIFPLLSAEDITLRRLRFLTESDLTYLFRHFKLGEKIEFRFHLLEWKRNEGLNTPDKTSIQLERDLDENDFEVPQPSTSSSTSNTSFVNQNQSFIDLLLALQDHPAGDYVKRTIDEKNSLNDTSRKILIEAIVTYMVKNKIKPGKADFDRISHDIEREFNDDKKIYYNCVGQRPSGRLYDKYYNTLKKLKKYGEVFDSSSSGKGPDSTEQKISNEKAAQAQKWLKSNDEPWSVVEEKWRLCYKLRRDDIVNTDGRKFSISWLLSQWSLYSHILGHLLVEIDFLILYPECPPLMSKWDSFREKITPILNQRLTDSVYLSYLEEINAHTEGSDQTLALLLHVLLLSMRKSNVKTTVKDSQSSFIIQATSYCKAEKQLETLKTKIYNSGETQKPIIVAIGGNFDCTKFYVYFYDIKYSAPDFLTAFDISFKIFHVLDLKYPVESFEFWMFVQKYFYGIHLDTDKVPPNILCLISDLK
ncbi:uncharacterized protein [Drosophila kikkawai]|uniref:Uncharacterized protein n=1 Tax=Drosophila kikkawai TaxID=30033 RepID=A0A6P4JRT0_DROKI|nr:uncharacterized protein LOC108085338 [Drosophila kikkawai]